MSAYVILDVEVKDPALYQEYAARAPATVQTYGGRYLARGGHTEKLEGEWLPKRLVILEFQTVEKAKAWLDSPEYRPVKQLRHQAAHTNLVMIEGV